MRPWHLVADIGGTNARFAVVEPDSSGLVFSRRYVVEDYPRFGDAIDRFLAETADEEQWTAFPEAACFALACPVIGERATFTNSSWRLDKAEVTEKLGKSRVEFINDFEAVGHGITRLRRADWTELCPGQAIDGEPVGVLGPGTGLGVGAVVPTANDYRVLAGEGGHVDFAPVDRIEVEVLEFLTEQYGRVSAERVISGQGLLNTYRALAAIGDLPAPLETTASVTEKALSGADPLARETLAVFCRCLGSFAGNLALTLGARGGIYIAGGIVPRILSFLLESEFETRFRAKGRFNDYIAAIPVRVINSADVGLAGAAIKLSEH